jgi:succinate dehydrogenase hydrophobic anchor subunit
MLDFALEFEEEGGGGRKEGVHGIRSGMDTLAWTTPYTSGITRLLSLHRHITIVCSEAQGRSRAVRTLLHNPFVGIILAIEARVETTK